MAKEDTSTLPVLIAGGGAAGTIMALLLAQQNIPSLVIESRLQPYDIPRAHAINPRSLEICAALGLDVERIQRQAAPRSEAGLVRFVPRLFGPLLGTLPYERQDDEASNYTPYPLVNIPQTEFEEILFEAAADDPLITIRRGHRWLRMSQNAEIVRSEIEGPDGIYAVESRYLLGCDGAGSLVRDGLGIAMSGNAAVQSCLSIIFKADLSQILAHQPGVLYWTTDPDALGTFISYHMDRLWSFVVLFPPGPIDMAFHTPEKCREIVLRAIGGDVADLEVLRLSPWTMMSQVAERYRDGRVFLIGDSAHRFPPTGGLGLNTGIQDAHNLAWKIAAVEQGWASPTLLETYETERRPVALRNSDQSLVNAQRLAALSELICPQEIWRDAQKFANWRAQPGKTEAIADAINLQAEHFDSFALQLGFAYPPHSDEPASVSQFQPSAKVGFRLPHGILRDQEKVGSIFELLDATRFTIFTATSTTLNWSKSAIPVQCVALSELNVAPEWLELIGLECGHALIVRPDGHIGWRGLESDAPDALISLVEAARKEEGRQQVIS